MALSRYDVPWTVDLPQDAAVIAPEYADSIRYLAIGDAPYDNAGVRVWTPGTMATTPAVGTGGRSFSTNGTQTDLSAASTILEDSNNQKITIICQFRINVVPVATVLLGGLFANLLSTSANHCLTLGPNGNVGFRSRGTSGAARTALTLGLHGAGEVITAVGVNRTSTRHEIYTDIGENVVNTAGSANPFPAMPVVVFGNHPAVGALDASIIMFAILAEDLAATEAQALAENPGRLFADRTIWVPVSAGVSGISASLAATLADATAAATGTVSLKGTASQTLADATVASAATLAIAGTTSQTLADATVVATGEGQVTTTGTLAVTLDDATAASTGALAISGSAAATLDDATLSSTAALAVAASTSATLDDATAASTAALAIQAATSQTLGDATLAATGVLTATGSGTLAAMLDDATLAAAATVGIKAQASPTLESATVSATGAVAIQATVGISLDAATLSAQGTAQTVTTGELSQTLADATVTATGVLPIVGTAGPTLADAILAATATMPLAGLAGIVTQTLEPATSAATATLRISGSLGITLGDATVSATNSDTLFSSSDWWTYQVAVQDIRYSVAPQSMTFTIER